jgi:hypothetical protein
VFFQDIHIKKFSEGFGDKMFDIGIIAALERALSDENYDLKKSAVEIFTAAMAQSALCFFFCRIFILKNLQRSFRTRYLILRLLPHLDVH